MEASSRAGPVASHEDEVGGFQPPRALVFPVARSHLGTHLSPPIEQSHSSPKAPGGRPPDRHKTDCISCLSQGRAECAGDPHPLGLPGLALWLLWERPGYQTTGPKAASGPRGVRPMPRETATLVGPRNTAVRSRARTAGNGSAWELGPLTPSRPTWPSQRTGHLQTQSCFRFGGAATDPTLCQLLPAPHHPRPGPRV